jgi:predicted nucleic acid-binding protein
MSAECLLDTNVWVYAAGSAPEEAEKKRRALALIAGGRWGISTQVLQEFYVTVTRKIARPLPPADAEAWIKDMIKLPCVATTPELVQRGIAINRRYQLSYWDGALLAAAESLGVRTVYSEDLGHGQEYEGIRVINPFLP